MPSDETTTESSRLKQCATVGVLVGAILLAGCSGTSEPAREPANASFEVVEDTEVSCLVRINVESWGTADSVVIDAPSHRFRASPNDSEFQLNTLHAIVPEYSTVRIESVHGRWRTTVNETHVSEDCSTERSA